MALLRTPRQGDRRIRVFSIPGKESKTEAISQTCIGLEQAGADLLSIKDTRLWTLSVDIINLHFPVHYIVERSIAYSLIRSVLSLTLYLTTKYIGRCKIVYTVHDVEPFRSRLGWLLWPLLSLIHKLVDGYMFLSDSSHEEFVRRFPSQAFKPWIRIDHGAFDVKLDETAVRRGRRVILLGDEKPCFLVGFLGEIKDYKGLEILPLLPRQLDDGTPVRLVIAGRVDPTYRHIADPILARLGGDPIRIDRRLPNQELEGLFQAMDLVLLPYTRGWNSGMAMLALSSRTRILTTRRPLFRELYRVLGVPWIYVCDVGPFPDAGSLARALMVARTDTVTAGDKARLRQFLEERSFARVGQALLGFYERLLRR